MSEFTRAPSMRIRVALIAEIKRARTWGHLRAVANGINEAGMDEPDRLSCWDAVARRTTQLGGRQWDQMPVSRQTIDRKFSGMPDLW